MKRPVIILSGLEKRFGSTTAVYPMDLEIPEGEFFTFVGPSGCGKTTTLRMIAGLEKPSSGRLKLGARVVYDDRTGESIPTEKRKIGMVFQSYALWPHMTVQDNISFGLAGLQKAEIRSRVADIMSMMKIAGMEKRYPSELSGGQQQRVALARELVTGTDIILMDEPLSNLDAKLRIDMRAELKRLHRETNKTIVYVTHDQVEALTLSSTLAVMNGGLIEQMGRPTEIYHNPQSLFVAEFMGSLPVNKIPAKLTSDGTVVGPHFRWGGFDNKEKRDQDITIGVRPESFHTRDNDNRCSLVAEILSVLPAGSHEIVHLQIEGSDQPIYVQANEDHKLVPGEKATLWVSPRRVLLFDQDSGQRIR